MNTISWRESGSGLLRRFGVAGFVVIIAIAAGNSVPLSGYMTKIMLEREARVSMGLVQNVLRSDGPIGYFADPGNAAAQLQPVDAVQLMQTCFGGSIRAQTTAGERGASFVIEMPAV